MIPVAALAGIALAVLTLIVAVMYIAWRIAQAVTRVGKHDYWDEMTFFPSDLSIPYEDVRFSSRDGLNLSAWLMPRQNPLAVIIMGSGYRDRKMSLLPIARRMWKQGFTLFLLDFRNQGSSERDSAQTMGWREVNDMLAAIDEVEKRAPGLAIVAMGFSMGAVVSIFTAAQDKRIAAVVADSAYADQSSIIANYLQRLYRLPPFPIVPLAERFIQHRAGYAPRCVRPVNVIAAIAPRPVLLIHGINDDLCPVEHAHRLYKQASEPKSLWIVENAAHTYAYFQDRDAYVTRVSTFLRQSLHSAAAGRSRSEA